MGLVLSGSRAVLAGDDGQFCTGCAGIRTVLDGSSHGG